MMRAHKIRLHPTSAQANFLTRCAGVARFVYNWGLAQWQTQYATGDRPSVLALKKQFNTIKSTQFPWVYDAPKDVAEGAFANLGAAFKNFFASVAGTRNGEKVGYPTFKSKKRSKPSFRLNNDKFKVDGHTFYVPRLGMVNMAEPLRLQGKIMGAVVSKVADWWYVSITVDVEPPPPLAHPHPSIGVDLGVKALATLSDGVVFENQKVLRIALNRCKRLQRTLSRRTPGSHRWDRTKRQLARFHKRIADTRADAIHKMTTQIACTYRLIGVEDLYVKGMGKNRRLALSLADASLGEILRQLHYKAAWCGGIVQKIGRFYASSKTCAACGAVNQQLTLSERIWTCQPCGRVHDRDWNASQNIHHEALRLLGASPESRSGVATSSVIARRQTIRPLCRASLVEASTFEYFSSTREVAERL